MCEQCVTNAETVLAEALPGYALMRARVGSSAWPEGWYGLVVRNDPEFVFQGPLLKDPLAGFSDEEINACSAELEEASTVFSAAAQGLQDSMSSLPALTGYELISACVQVGYDIKRDGTETAYWLMHHLSTAVEKA